jgi:hypothetical protein
MLFRENSKIPVKGNSSCRLKDGEKDLSQETPTLVHISVDDYDNNYIILFSVNNHP